MLRHAMILAAGRGERMRPLTDSCPKPLLLAGGQPLIVWHLKALAKAGFKEVVINHAYLGYMIEQSIGHHAFGMGISYSAEPSALETAGGIRQALPHLGDGQFLVINGDVFCDFNLARAHTIATQMSAQDRLGWCVLVDNPPHHPLGDFGLRHGLITHNVTTKLTFAGIGVYHQALFAALPAGEPAKLAPLLFAAIEQRRIGGQYHNGYWLDVGTPERLAELNLYLATKDQTDDA